MTTLHNAGGSIASVLPASMSQQQQHVELVFVFTVVVAGSQALPLQVQQR